MTARQRQLHDRVLAYRDELLKAADRRVGANTIVRLPLKFVPYGYERATLVMLLRLPDSVAYREYCPWSSSKRYAEPRWRTLARVA